MFLLISPTSIGALVVISAIGAVLHRLFFHPLAKYPGPLLCKLSGWHQWSAVTSGDHHVWLYNIHEKYGPVVRVAPNRLSYNNTSALRSIYGDRKANIQKAGFTEMIATFRNDARNLQTINERSVYQIRRRLIAHAFSEDALRSSEAYILDCVRKWCTLLQSKAETPKAWTSDIDMKVWANLLTEDILGELCFGESFGALDRGSSNSGELAVEGCKQAQILSWMPMPEWFYSVMGIILNYGMKQKWAALKPQLDYDHAIQSMMDRRMATSADRKDFAHYILQAKDPETGATITTEEIRAEAGVLFGAGMDTSATCIASCLYYLTRYPEALAKLTKEIRSTFDNVEDIVQGQKLSSLTYLRACIDETLRFTPPAPGPMLRTVTPGGLNVDGEYLPAGVEVSVAAYTIHHNETYFPNSWTFNPDRWLPETLAASRDAFCAFQLGPRVCIGRQLAYLDMSLALARLLFLFDIRQSPNKRSTWVDNGKVEYQIKDWFITDREGPFVQLRARV